MEETRRSPHALLTKAIQQKSVGNTTLSSSQTNRELVAPSHRVLCANLYTGQC